MKEIKNLLEDYTKRYPEEAAKATEFLSLADRGVESLNREHYVPGHFTSSVWLLNASRDAALMTHHKKLNLWLQPGGHVDGEVDLLASAIREGVEESGITAISALDSAILDIDRHAFPARGEMPAHDHFDCRFLLVTKHDEYIVSEESHDLRWVPLVEMPDFVSEEGILRMWQKANHWLATSSQ